MLAVLSSSMSIVFLIFIILFAPKALDELGGQIYILYAIYITIVLVTGMWSYLQIKKSGEKGKYLAITGIMVGSVSIIGPAIVALILFSFKNAF